MALSSLAFFVSHVVPDVVFWISIIPLITFVILNVGSLTSPKLELKMLDYQNAALLDILHEDGLLIMAK